MNSCFINGFLMTMLRKSCHPTYLGYWSHIKQRCSSFCLELKYTKQKPHFLLCDFLCPRATDFLPNTYVSSLILLERFLLIWTVDSGLHWRECLESLEDKTVFSRLSGDSSPSYWSREDLEIEISLPISVSLYWEAV